MEFNEATTAHIPRHFMSGMSKRHLDPRYRHNDRELYRSADGETVLWARSIHWHSVYILDTPLGEIILNDSEAGMILADHSAELNDWQRGAADAYNLLGGNGGWFIGVHEDRIPDPRGAVSGYFSRISQLRGNIGMWKPVQWGKAPWNAPYAHKTHPHSPVRRSKFGLMR